MPNRDGNHMRSLAVRIEEIMTPRSLLVVVPEHEIGRAADLARENEFEAIPIVSAGRIAAFWSQSAGGIRPITRRHRLQHDESVDWALRRLVDHGIQFVYYRDEIVGLVDVSDLNKPLARLVMFRPLLELEQAISLTVRARRIPDEKVAAALGPEAARRAWKCKKRAIQEDLGVPLLESVGFPDALRVGAALGVVPLTPSDIKRLTEIRNRAAHGVLSFVQRREDGRELIWALQRCREIRNGVRGA